MEWIIMGSGTHVPLADRGSACHLLLDDGKAALFDCGTGAKDRMARAGVALEQVSHVFISHAHLDHWGDLPSLLFHRSNAPTRPKLSIVAPQGFYTMFQQLAAMVSSSLIDPDVRFIEPEHAVETDWFSVRAFVVSHGKVNAVAYRVEGQAGSVCYSGDTGPCEGIEAAARGSDLLVCECALPASAGVASHMTPQSVRSLADQARPGQLALTHLYPEVLAPGIIESAFEGYEGKMVVGADGMRIAFAQPPGMKMIG